MAKRLRDAIARLNPDLPADALDGAFRKLTHLQGTTLEARNRVFHRVAVDGVTVEYRDAGGAVRGAQARVIDFDDPANNDWLAVNQFTVVENRHERRPDVVPIRQRPAAGGHRTEEPDRRRDHHLDCLAAVADLQGRNSLAVRLQRRELIGLVRRILRQHGYPPDKQEKATQTVLEQAEVLSAGWAA